MDKLPGHLLDKVLFRMDPKSLSKMRCTNSSMQSHIYDPWFESKYFSQIRSDVLHISTYASNLLCYHTLGDSRSVRVTKTLIKFQILDSCSGLVLLLFVDKGGLCVANPLTKKFRFLSHSKLMPLVNPEKIVHRDDRKLLGFTVNRIDRTTQSFKIVQIIEVENSGKTMYKFEINSGNSWRYSKTKITCFSSKVSNLMRKPVYLDGSLHWLREDGSILSFNPETEQARLIPVLLPEELHSRTLFASGDSSNLILISATVEDIYVYSLENILTDPKWVLVRQIKNGVLDVKWLRYWKLEAYDGKCLVLSEERMNIEGAYQVVHVYDLSTNKWLVTSSIPGWSDVNQDIFLFTPSFYSVIGLSDEMLACDDQRISSLRSIMRLVNGNSSEAKVETNLRKRSLEEEEEKTSVVEEAKKS